MNVTCVNLDKIINTSGVKTFSRSAPGKGGFLGWSPGESDPLSKDVNLMVCALLRRAVMRFSDFTYSGDA